MINLDVIGRASLVAFGEAVMILTGPASPGAVRAVFDSNFYAADDGESVSVDLVTTISINTSDAVGLAVDNQVLVRGKTYRIRERRPDSENMTVFELEED